MENLKETIHNAFSESLLIEKVMIEDSELMNKIFSISQIIIDTLKTTNKIILFGNGGSAADCQHIAAEYVCRFKKDRVAIPAIALTTDSSNLTAIANDYGFEYIFSRQIESIGNEGDLVFAYSTSGKSKNIIEGLIKAKQKKITTVGMTGNESNEMNKYCDYIINIPSSSVARIQEKHTLVGHIICEIVEDYINCQS